MLTFEVCFEERLFVPLHRQSINAVFLLHIAHGLFLHKMTTSCIFVHCASLPLKELF